MKRLFFLLFLGLVAAAHGLVGGRALILTEQAHVLHLQALKPAQLEHVLQAEASPASLALDLRALRTPERIVQADLEIFHASPYFLATLELKSEMAAAATTAHYKAGSKRYHALHGKDIPPPPPGVTGSYVQKNYAGTSEGITPVILATAQSGSNWRDLAQAAVTSTSSAGGGTVLLPSASINFPTPVTLLNGVRVLGIPPTLVYSQAVADEDWTPSGGTQINPTTIGFVSNSTALFNYTFCLAGATSATQNLFSTANLSATQQIYDQTANFVATVSTVNTHQNVTLTSSATMGTNDQIELPVATVVTAGTFTAGQTITIASVNGSGAYGLNAADVVYCGTAGVQRTFGTVNQATGQVTLTSTVTLATGENLFVVSQGANWANASLTGAALENLTFVGGVSGFQLGGSGMPGPTFGYIKRIWTKGCSGPGYSLVNLFHNRVSETWDDNSAGGVLIDADNIGPTLQPGNMDVDEVYLYDDSNNFTAQGLRVECHGTGNTIGGWFTRDQVNRFNRNLQTITLTPVSTSSTLYNYSGSSSNLCVGMPFLTQASAPDGLTSSVIDFVTSINTGTSQVTIASSPVGVDIVPTATTAVTTYARGMPLLAVENFGGGGCNDLEAVGLDLENAGTVCALVVGSNAVWLQSGDGLPANPTPTAPTSSSTALATFCLRGSSDCTIDTPSANDVIDEDGNCARTFIPHGAMAPNGFLQYAPVGLWYDALTTDYIFGMYGNSGSNQGRTFEARNASGPWIAPDEPIGMHVSTPGNGSTLNGSNVGYVLANGSGSPTWNYNLTALYPNTVTTPNQVGYTSGLIFIIKNELATAGVLTVTTATSPLQQYFDPSIGGGSQNVASIPYGGVIIIIGAPTNGNGVSGTNQFWHVMYASSGVTYSSFGDPAMLLLGAFLAFGAWHKKKAKAKNNFAFSA